MVKKILIAEDDRKIAELISKYLSIEGLEAKWAKDGVEAIEFTKEWSPDLCILDIMLPGIDGYSACETIRKASNVPVIMLTARIEEVDRLLGFSKGADDYVCKPFNPKELMARIQAILRRTAGENDKCDILSFGPIRLIRDEHKAVVDDRDITLTYIEFRLLWKLLGQPSRVYSREDLLTAIQGSYSEPYERTIDFHIKNLRKKLRTKDEYRFITTVYGVGYKFN